ncbi:MAG: DUF1801 domain-containing protein [Ilumatobacteraceae bacterium]
MTALPPPSTVDGYLDTLNGEARRIAIQMRAAIHAAAPEITEEIRYKMPCFLLDGTYLVYFGSWKHHIGLYPIPVLDAELEAEIAPYRTAKDTVRFRYKDPVPWDVIERLLAELVRRRTGRAGDDGFD